MKPRMDFFLILTLLIFEVSAYSKPGHVEDKIARLMDQMTDEEKILSLFVFPFYNSKIIKKMTPGGMVLHGRINEKSSEVEKLINNVHQFQKKSREKYGVLGFVLTDGEGGEVSRFSRKRYQPFKNTLFYDVVSPNMIAQTNNHHLAYKIGEAVGGVLHSVGVNMNIAPVVDLADPHQKGYISLRVFGEDPHVVQKFSHAYNQGLLKSNVIGIFKHFPGYGNTKVNTHSSISHISSSKEDLLKRDIIPYLPLTGHKAPQAIMTNVGLYSKLDAVHTAPLSSRIIQEFLRKELKFEGLVMPDALNMGGFKEKDFSKKVVKSLIAGNDLTLVYTSSYKQAEDALKASVKALQSGLLSRKTLNQAVRRTLLFKLKLSFDHKKTMERRLKTYHQKLDRLYKINYKIVSHNIDVFFKNHPHLKNILAEDSNIAMFAPPSFKENSYKKLNHFKTAMLINDLLQPKMSKVLKKLKEENYISICYGGFVTYCNKLGKDLKKKMIIIKTKSNMTLNKKEFLAVIPTYGSAIESAPLILEKLIEKNRFSSLGK